MASEISLCPSCAGAASGQARNSLIARVSIFPAAMQVISPSGPLEGPLSKPQKCRHRNFAET